MEQEILNHMDADELRNYAAHCEMVTDACTDLNTANRELVRDYRQLVIDMEHQQDVLLARNAKMVKLATIERELRDKYAEYLPRPCCPVRDL